MTTRRHGPRWPVNQRLCWATGTMVVLLAGCATPPADAPARCASTVVQLLDPVPLFTGPQASAALDRGLSKGQRLQLCRQEGTRQQVLLPRAGQRCDGPKACASGWIPRGAKTAALR